MISVDTQNPLNYKEMISNDVHSARIMGVWIDGIRNLVYTISEDKTLKVLDIKMKQIIAEVNVGSSKLCCMEIDAESKTAFISDRAGQIHIYDLIPNRPCFMQVISTPSKSAIRGLQVDISKGLLFASCYDDGFIYGYKLGYQGKKVKSFLH